MAQAKLAEQKTKTLTLAVNLDQVAEMIKQLSDEDLDTLDLLLDKKQTAELIRRGAEYNSLKKKNQLLDSKTIWERVKDHTA